MQEIAAVILAAGLSSRMAEFKPLLPLGNSTVIETAVGIFRQAGIEDITVVVGHRADDLKPILERMHVKWVMNVKYREGMFSSIVAGLQSLGPEVKAFFLLPVDIPLVRSSTIERISAEYLRLGPRIFYPAYHKQRGHPPLIPSAVFSDIISWSGEGGLQAFLLRYEAHAVEVEVQDAGTLLDIDTPEDYENIRRMSGHAR